MVYVGIGEYKYGRMIMSHMIADSINELHEMADILGVKRKWFQDKATKPHYDICKKKKMLALNYGAKLINDMEIIIKLQTNNHAHG
jgi:hypothetical protein